mmetsp:Transcript_120968/g.337575  ORF Transcript_120968/g.337575 Transcript_120968/m.337575 type:complete len:252 (-) Transcript_120968:434-1189(-)
MVVCCSCLDLACDCSCGPVEHLQFCQCHLVSPEVQGVLLHPERGDDSLAKHFLQAARVRHDLHRHSACCDRRLALHFRHKVLGPHRSAQRLGPECRCIGLHPGAGRALLPPAPAQGAAPRGGPRAAGKAPPLDSRSQVRRLPQHPGHPVVPRSSPPNMVRRAPAHGRKDEGGEEDPLRQPHGLHLRCGPWHRLRFHRCHKQQRDLEWNTHIPRSLAKDGTCAHRSSGAVRHASSGAGEPLEPCCADPGATD